MFLIVSKRERKTTEELGKTERIQLKKKLNWCIKTIQNISRKINKNKRKPIHLIDSLILIKLLLLHVFSAIN